jgi:Domain of unknown function (DUF5655)
VPDAEGRWTVEDHLRNAPAEHVDLFRRLAAAVCGFGPVTLSPSRTTVTFKGSRRGFLGARPTARGVEGYLDLTRSLVGDPRILRSTPYTGRLHVNRYRLASADELDATFLGWLREGYAVGQGAHLR